MQKETIEESESSLSGALLQPNGANYEEARTIWNGMIDKRPALIALSNSFMS